MQARFNVRRALHEACRSVTGEAPMASGLRLAHWTLEKLGLLLEREPSGILAAVESHFWGCGCCAPLSFPSDESHSRPRCRHPYSTDLSPILDGRYPEHRLVGASACSSETQENHPPGASTTGTQSIRLRVPGPTGCPTGFGRAPAAARLRQRIGAARPEVDSAPIGLTRSPWQSTEGHDSQDCRESCLRPSPAGMRRKLIGDERCGTDSG